MGGGASKAAGVHAKFNQNYMLTRELGSGAFSVVKLGIHKDGLYRNGGGESLQRVSDCWECAVGDTYESKSMLEQAYPLEIILCKSIMHRSKLSELTIARDGVLLVIDNHL